MSIWTRFRIAERSVLRRFVRDERAATALEFAILGIPFFAIIGAILETALIFLASQILDSAVQDASRYIRTGQAQSHTPAYQLADFNTLVCNRLFGIFDCSKLKIQVKKVTNFTSAQTTTSPLDPNDPTKWVLTPSFDDGSGSDVIMVQVYYKWPVILNFDGLNLMSNSDGTHLLGSVRVFANEPFTS